MAPLVRARGLGEVVLRVRNMVRAVAFYRDVLGLTVLRTFDDRITFLKIDSGFEGHERVVGLFHAEEPSNRVGTAWKTPDPSAPTLHHFALEIPLSEYESTLKALTGAGLTPNTQEHRWIGWRSIYITDPDGNVVELVAVDPSIRSE
jgi:catechol 2,3-dioxygenase